MHCTTSTGDGEGDGPAGLQLDVAARIAPSQALENFRRRPQPGAAGVLIEHRRRPVGPAVQLGYPEDGPFTAPGRQRTNGHVLGALVLIADEYGDRTFHPVHDPDDVFRAGVRSPPPGIQ